MNPNAIQWNPDVLNGLRDSNWDMSAELQQELADGISVTVGYYFNNGGYNQQSDSKNRRTDNLAVTPDDYTEYCIMAPTNAGLPGGGGNEICGLVRPQPGQVRPEWTTSSPGPMQVRGRTSVGITSSM